MNHEQPIADLANVETTLAGLLEKVDFSNIKMGYIERSIGKPQFEDKLSFTDEEVAHYVGNKPIAVVNFNHWEAVIQSSLTVKSVQLLAANPLVVERKLSSDERWRSRTQHFRFFQAPTDRENKPESSSATIEKLSLMQLAP